MKGVEVTLCYLIGNRDVLPTDIYFLMKEDDVSHINVFSGVPS